MAQPARNDSIRRMTAGVQLTIVPADSFDPMTPDPAPLATGTAHLGPEPATAEIELDAPLEAPEPAPAKAEPKAPAKAQRKPAPKARPSAANNTAVPAPRRGRTGLLMAGALGGGVMMGGGVVGLVSLVVGAVGAVLLGLWLLLSSSTVEEVPVVVPVAIEVGLDEAAPEDGDASAPATEGRGSTTSPTPSGGSSDVAPAAPVASQPTPAPAAPAPAPTPADEALPTGSVMVKVLTDPPAARLWVDGADAGRSPAKLTLEPGSHQLMVESGKASGTFSIDAGLDSDRFCFEARGKKLSMVGCN